MYLIINENDTAMKNFQKISLLLPLPLFLVKNSVQYMFNFGTFKR
ncbi:hypothetical protein HMPREF1860_01281 [Prevotella amnii]|uniref:Uncharacterized protein n=1 Tax=Prevotella amnii TaxID=419005 RepID=A0A134BCP4_9BACT|nr:hypothetical protein HMPREF1860_01281 [Prevotella amnii]